MKTLIVAKTRRGSGACIGAISFSGKSLRLEVADAATNETAGLECNCTGNIGAIQTTVNHIHNQRRLVLSMQL